MRIRIPRLHHANWRTAAARWNQFARQLSSNLLAHGEGTILH